MGGVRLRVARSLGWKEGKTQRKTRPPQAGLGFLPQKRNVTVTSSGGVVKVMAAFWYPPKKGGTAMPGSKKGAIDLTAPYQSQNKPTNKPKASPHDLSWPETHPKHPFSEASDAGAADRPTDPPTQPPTDRSFGPVPLPGGFPQAEYLEPNPPFRPPAKFSQS